MMQADIILDEIKEPVALWCGADVDATDLANATSVALARGIDIISVAPDGVRVVWPWIENAHKEILGRFYVNRADEGSVSELSANINSVFKSGADGAQVFVKVSELGKLVSQLYSIRDDLFFNKRLYVGLDIGEIGPFDWDDVFSALRKIRASGLILVLARDAGDKSDFVGRLYAGLCAWNAPDACVHFVVGGAKRIEEANRLVQSVCPKLAPDARFFVNILGTR